MKSGRLIPGRSVAAVTGWVFPAFFVFLMAGIPPAYGEDQASTSRRRVPDATAQFELKTPPSLPPVKPWVVRNGSRGTRRIALTFDACSTKKPGQFDEKVIRELVETKTPATLFLGGKWMEEQAEKTKYLASLPQFELANHAFLHPHLTKLSDARIREELQMTQKVMYSLTGKQATLFRPPYGEYDERVVRIAAEMGLTTVEYDLPSGDPDVHATKDKLVKYVIQKVRNGSIVVMHVNRRGWHTAEALPDIISELRRRGFALVTVGELLRESRELQRPTPIGQR